MVCAVSKDGGDSWSDPTPVVPPQPGRHEFGTVTAMGIREHEGVLAAYYGYYDFTDAGYERYHIDGCVGKSDPDLTMHSESWCGITVSRDGGSTWRYCDLDGSDDGYSPAQAGTATVTAP